jgi:hypothetical protein
VLASTDCGVSYTDTLFNESRIALANAIESDASWEPSVVPSDPENSEWQDLSIALNKFLGQPDVRIAFVFVNDHGNNIYLDNINVFISNEPSPDIGVNSMLVYPNPYSFQGNGAQVPWRVTFNFAQKSPVVIEVIDVLGKVLFSEQPENVLNQTYTISAPDISPGTYFVRAKSDAGIFTQKVFVVK